MLRYILLALGGIAGGLLGGMGMGGGTLLIPILSVLFKVDQKIAQAINLISFLPTAVVALAIHLKNGLCRFDGYFAIVLPAILLSVGGFFLQQKLETELLRKLFGGFLIALSAFQTVLFFKTKEKK